MKKSFRSHGLSRRTALTIFGVGAIAAGFRGRSLVLGCLEREPDPDRQEVLRQTVRIVMLPTFAELVEKTTALATAASQLHQAPSAEAAAKTRQAWRDARGVWKRSEAFLIGPSDDLAVTGGIIDSWPAATDKIDLLLEGTEPLDQPRASTLAANLRGFPGIEYLLFANSNEAEADNNLLKDRLAGRRRELVASDCAELAKKCAALNEAWAGPQGYGHELAEAGASGKLFSRQRDAVDKVVTAMLALAELMQVAKLAKPLGLDTGGPIRPELEEAPRSDASLQAIEQNLVGLKALYQCHLGDQTGESLSNEVRKISTGADETFLNSVDDALRAVRAITTPMRTLLKTNREPLLDLHTKIQTVKRSVAMDVASSLGASLGFGYSDSD